jgi:hypothetical protein
MASHKGIDSSFSKQLSVRSAKRQIYESLCSLNQGIDQVLAHLRGIQRFSLIDKDSLQFAIVEIEEARAGINADIAERLSDSERLEEGRFWKERRHFEKKWHDPDDVYLDVERREEQRKRQGLPLRVGVIPYSTVSGEKEFLPARQRQDRKRHNARRGRPQ